MGALGWVTEKGLVLMRRSIMPLPARDSKIECLLVGCALMRVAEADSKLQ